MLPFPWFVEKLLPIRFFLTQQRSQISKTKNKSLVSKTVIVNTSLLSPFPSLVNQVLLQLLGWDILVQYITICYLDKYIWQFGQIQCPIWTNIFYIVFISITGQSCFSQLLGWDISVQYMTIGYLEQIAIWTNMFYNFDKCIFKFDKYMIQFGQIYFTIYSITGQSCFPTTNGMRQTGLICDITAWHEL